MPGSSDIRRQFIDYFRDRHTHTFVPSSPVVPHDDATLLFTNAGMVQFKDVFLGTGTRTYPRAVNSQKCIRAGGKHNDLEDVGKDTYHHTFFEMLGNWSFGDYFKAEAIEWAWDLLTNIWGLPRERLYVTVFAGDEADSVPADDEAATLWSTVTDLDPAHISRWGKKDNFWEMADTGPCGPNSEIHIDLTPDASGAKLVNRDDPRVIELWNLVFIQFNRDTHGHLTTLPAKHVDTGLGYERICAVLQGKTSDYETDVFTPLFEVIRDVSGVRSYGGSLEDPIDVAYRVVADHVRCLTFALTDGAVPSNEGRGYVLRRILRRAFRHGRQTLGLDEPFLYRLVPAVTGAMGEAFPELTQNPQQVEDLIREEEESFGRTIDRGITLFDQAAQTGETTISGDDAFRLYDTYGFPLDLTQVMAEERGMTVDVERFNRQMAQARQRSRAAVGEVDARSSLVDIVRGEKLRATDFVGYEQTETKSQHLWLCLYRLEDRGYVPVQSAGENDRVAIVAASTPFYAEAGGQVGDTGVITFTEGTQVEVSDTIRVGDVVFHLGHVSRGRVEAGDLTEVVLVVDKERRARAMPNHTGTHLLNRALRVHVNPRTEQKGSLVDDQRLRFDFSHHAALTGDHIRAVEDQVNADIAMDLGVYCGDAPLEEARKIKGLRAVFGEKYPPRVRVVSIGVPVGDLLADPQNERWRNYSIEFCGGTHLKRTGEAEHFVVVGEEAVAKGVRRITALTGAAAQEAEAQARRLLQQMDGDRGAADPHLLPDQIAALTQAIQTTVLPARGRAALREGLALLQEALKVEQKIATKAAAADVTEQAREIADQTEGNVIISTVPGADAETLRTAMDVIRKRRPEAAMLLASVAQDKVTMLAAVPPDLIAKGLKAGDWVRQVAKVTGGGGGGRPDMAQAGGKEPAKLAEALQVARQFAEAKLGS